MRTAAAVALGAVLLAGCGSTVHGARTLSVSGAYVSHGSLFLTVHGGAGPDLLEAVVAPAATSATWTMDRPVHTPAEVAAYAELCGDDPRLLAQAGAALASASDVIVPAGGSVALRPGTGSITLHDARLYAGSRTPVTLWFASGAHISLSVPVRA